MKSPFLITAISMRDIRSLDLNLLKAFNALLDEGNVTRAAERLGLTQPAVSGMLGRLRESFDDPLFVRTQRGILPTTRASELAGPIRQILAEVEALLRPTDFDPATAEFTVSVAATDYALHAVVLPFLPSLRTKAPGIRVSVSHVENDDTQARFERGELDLALLTPETAPQDLHSRKLFDETYVCAMRHDHPHDRGGQIDLNLFCDLDHALVSFSGQGFHGVTDEALAAVGRERKVVLSVMSFLVLSEVLRTTDLLAVVPSRLVRFDPTLVMMPPPVDIPGFSKIAVWHDRTHRDPGHRWFRSLLFEAIASQANATKS